MRKLFAVDGLFSAELPHQGLKQRSLLFDKIYVEYESGTWDPKYVPAHLIADEEYLRSRGFIETYSAVSQMDDIMRTMKEYREHDSLDEIFKNDINTRFVSESLTKITGVETVPLCEHELPPELARDMAQITTAKEQVLRIGMSSLPVPDDTAAWEDILNFKHEMNEKSWGFRRFLKTLASKSQTEAEIRDDIEWSLNEYSKAMKLHRIKSSNSFVDVFLIAPLEIVEDVVKLKWSKIAKGVLSAKNRQVELLQSEMGAPGKECAYIFDAQKKFG